VAFQLPKRENTSVDLADLRRSLDTAFTRDPSSGLVHICPVCDEDRAGTGQFEAGMCRRCYDEGYYPGEKRGEPGAPGQSSINDQFAKMRRLPDAPPIKRSDPAALLRARHQRETSQVFYNIPLSRGSTRPRGRVHGAGAPPKDKYGAYRARRRASGCCPHCGQPCAPYYECEARRFYKRLLYHLTKAARLGILLKLPGNYWGLPGRDEPPVSS
jgi:hypothetical protein